MQILQQKGMPCKPSMSRWPSAAKSLFPKRRATRWASSPARGFSCTLKAGRLVIEKKIQLDLSRWVGKAIDDGLTTSQALAELRGHPVPWQAEDAQPDAAAATKPAGP